MNVLLVLRAASRLLLGRVVELGGADLAVRGVVASRKPRPPTPSTHARPTRHDRQTHPGKAILLEEVIGGVAHALGKLLVRDERDADSRKAGRRAASPADRERAERQPAERYGEGGGGRLACGSAMNRRGEGALHSHLHFVRWERVSLQFSKTMPTTASTARRSVTLASKYKFCVLSGTHSHWSSRV